MTQSSEREEVKISADKALIDALRERFPETKRLSYSDLVDFALRKFLEKR